MNRKSMAQRREGAPECSRGKAQSETAIEGEEQLEAGYLDMSGRIPCPTCQRVVNCICTSTPCPENHYVDMDEMKRENKSRIESAKRRQKEDSMTRPGDNFHIYDDVVFRTEENKTKTRKACCILL